MNKVSKSFVVLFSEVIWVYYIIAVFTSVEWNKVVFVDATAWIIAGIVGYALNGFLAGRIHYLLLVLGNGLVLGFILIQNWIHAIPDGSWMFGVFISLAVSFVFIRSAGFVYKEPSRQHMLHRFEGNIMVYAVIALISTVNQWENELLHIVFLVAIFISLMGMILTLKGHEQGLSNGKQKIEVHKVGRSGWFTAVMSLLLLGIAIVSSILFLPSIQRSLQALGIGGLAGIKWIVTKVLDFFVWIFGFFPEPKSGGELPEMEPTPPIPTDEMPEEALFSLPYAWIFGIVGVIAVVIGIWVLSKFLKQWQPPKKMKSKRVFMFKNSLWTHFKEKCMRYVRRLRARFLAKFPRFYKHHVYWYFHQVQRWGVKKGFRRLPSETSKEYIEKVVSGIDTRVGTSIPRGECDQLMLRLRQLNQAYQATYYGGDVGVSMPVPEFKLLMNQLRHLRMSKKIARGNIWKRLFINRSKENDLAEERDN